MTIKERLSKRSGVRNEMLHDVRQFVRVAYVKGITKSLTTSDTTLEVRWRVCQLAWYLVQQTDAVNLLIRHVVIKH